MSQQNGNQFVIDENDRYSRLRLIGWWDQDRLAASRVLVVGAGALGNEVLKNLALVGIGKIYIIDFDSIQHSNLSRSVLFRAADAGRKKSIVACDAVQQLNPDCDVVPVVGDVLTDIGLGLVREVDVAIGCLDNREARLWLNRMCWKVGTPWIDGGIQEINGVAKVFVPPSGPCYECGMTEKDYQLIQLRYSCPLLKLEEMQQGKVPTAPTIASIIGGLQAQEALKLIHALPNDAGAAMVFNGASNNFYKSKFVVRDGCLSHEHYDPIFETDLTNRDTVQTFFDIAERICGQPIESIELDRDFLTVLRCQVCAFEKQINQPRSAVSMELAICGQCSEVMAAETVHEVTATSLDVWGERELGELGVPQYDIVKAKTNNETYFLLLEGDRVAVL